MTEMVRTIGVRVSESRDAGVYAIGVAQGLEVIDGLAVAIEQGVEQGGGEAGGLFGLHRAEPLIIRIAHHALDQRPAIAAINNQIAILLQRQPHRPPMRPRLLRQFHHRTRRDGDALRGYGFPTAKHGREDRMSEGGREWGCYRTQPYF